MQNIIIEKPYKFIPPKNGRFWPAVLKYCLPYYLKKVHGIQKTVFIGAEKLQASIREGHGVILAPNHCRPCDPMILGMLDREIGAPFYIMASWHLFMQGGLISWLLPRLGVFSMYREGFDRDAIKYAVKILSESGHPILVIFPEGIISRTNDRLNHLMEGTALIARAAAKQRASRHISGKVVVHPVAIRYFFNGNVEESLKPTLDEIEKRLSWMPRFDVPVLERIYRIGNALLSLKEIEFFGGSKHGSAAFRTKSLIDRILEPIENEWLKTRRDGDVVSRVKTLRAAILPEMISGKIPENECRRRRRQLADLYLVQQLYFYPPDYFNNML